MFPSISSAKHYMSKIHGHRHERMDFQKVMDAITDCEIISFDIFDTLVIRPYVNPTDLFMHMEVNEDIPGFHRERVNAERNCRRRGNPEITYDEIYGEIDRRFLCMKEIELDYERSLLRTNTEMEEIFRHARESGKKVVITSDMYLPSEFLDKVLQKNGYSGYQKIYVSCEHRCNKRTGELFKIIMDDFGTEPGSILHIGDNKHSDYSVPKRLGMGAIWYESIMSQYFSHNRRESYFYHRNKNLGASVITAMDASKWLKNGKRESENYWYDVSYRFGGLMTYSYLRFIKHNLSNDSKKIFFVARDGYNLIRIFNLLYNELFDCEYLYVPRVFRHLNSGSNKNSGSYAHWIVKYFSNHDEIKGLVSDKKLSINACIRIYNDNTEVFDSLRLKEMEKYLRYISRMLDEGGNINVVDVTTLEYSSQRLVESFANKSDVTGYYYIALKNSTNEKHFTYHDRSRRFSNWSEVNVSEFFMSSPEPPINGISEDSKPVYREDNLECELFRISIQEDILAGETDYATDMMEMFGKKLPMIDPGSVRLWTKLLIGRKSKADQENILKMKWAPGFDHKEYYYMIFDVSDIVYHIKNKGAAFIKKFTGN